MFCHNCGEQLSDAAIVCPKCGVATKKAATSSINQTKIVAGLLVILLGSFGVHKFYLGDTKMGIIYLLFSWTGIPSIIGLIEGILYLVASDEEFQQKYVKN